MKRVVIALVAVFAVVGCDRSATPKEQPATKSSAAASVAAPQAAALDGGTEVVELPEVPVRPNTDTTILVTWVTPAGTTLNDDAPFRVRWNRSDGLADAPADIKTTGSAIKDGLAVKIHPMAGAPNATLGGEINIVVCDAVNHSVCLPVRRNLELGFVVTKDAHARATVAIPLPAAK